MAQESGKISVQTENIFPIIKKWLYSEKDIFLRELISNAVDAITKLKKISLSEEFEGGTDYKVDVVFDAEARTLSIEDNGIGMSLEEIKKYINQIAFSSAEEFVKKYENQTEGASIIGHFGLGFYSAFMVSKKVTIETKSYKKNEEGIRWESESGVDFTINSCEKEIRGTKITLDLDSDSGEYLDKWKLKELVKKYCDFLDVPIYVAGEQANKQKALWSSSPSGVKKEDYKEFYNYLFPFSGEPHFWVHLNVDYPFRLQGILYFPKITHELEVNKSAIKLYCNHVFVSDEANELVPNFLTVLKGTIDIPDLPLNVSRSYLQTDPLVKKISAHIIKKIADKLVEEFKRDRTEFEKTWDDIALFVKYGMMSDEKFYESARSIVLYKSSKGGYISLDDYWTNNKEKNQNKVYYAPETEAGSSLMELFQSQGLEAILTDSKIDSHFLQFLESKNQDMHFSRVDSDIVDDVIDKDATSQILDSENKTESDRIKDLFQTAIGRDGLELKVEALKSSTVPGFITLPEHMRRLTEMNLGMNQDKSVLLKNHTFVLNSASPLIKNILSIANGPNPEKAKRLATQVYDLALLSSKVMSENELGSFVKKSYEVLETLT
ncbi:MAG: molecular chaperone HtpG [Leptospiraceae bacterium]|nr:molecular chaperone HtpG [Leptospiraceae bacterium]